MKEVNLKSIIEAYESMQESIFNKYLEYFQINIKEHEKKDLSIFVDLLSEYCDDTKEFSRFFLGFVIPQIGKEFDLLRFGTNFNINVELKSTNIGKDGIREQLIRNKYYLGFLPVETFYFTFVSDEKRTFFLNDLEELIEVDIHKLIERLMEQEGMEIDNINSLFNPSDFLVSPFNSTEKFISNKYFLTKQQKDFKKQVINEISSKENLFLGLTGEAGTGKTLLTYDIAKQFLDNTLIIHCGMLNEGHIVLRDKYDWNIIPIRDISSTTVESILGSYDIVIIDETQRILSGQFDLIVGIARMKNMSCIFSYDKKQILGNWEENKIDIKEAENNFKTFNLTKKIRTNKEISNFVKGFFEKDRTITGYYNKSNIEVLYFKTKIEAQKYVTILTEKDWKMINYTPSNRHVEYERNSPMYNIYGGSGNAHTVIGQEFDKIVVVVDNTLFYNSNNKLSTKYPRPYYLPVKMLFQIMTRVRKELCIIVIDNDAIMDRCLNLLK